MVSSTQWSYRGASLTAGVGLLLLAGLSVLGLMGAVEGLTTEGDAARTAADIRASEGLFRLGIVALFATVALDVVVAWAMYRVFRPVHAGLSGLAAVLRLVYSGVFLVGIAHLLAVPRLLEDQSLTSLGTDQQQAQALLQIDAFSDLHDAGLVLFGLHLVVVGVLLAFRTGTRRILGTLVLLAGVGYVFDPIAAVLTAGAAPEVKVFTFVGEVLLALWLIAQVRRTDSDVDILETTHPATGHTLVQDGAVR